MYGVVARESVAVGDIEQSKAGQFVNFRDVVENRFKAIEARIKILEGQIQSVMSIAEKQVTDDQASKDAYDAVLEHYARM